MRKAVRKKFSHEEKYLIRRYLIWCYKTTKEELDRIDRKFTQLEVDRYILATLLARHHPPSAGWRASSKLVKQILAGEDNIKNTDHAAFQAEVENFKLYIADKEKTAGEFKYSNGKQGFLNAKYVYLERRLQGTLKAITAFLGSAELKKIQSLYEEEMTQRILQARENT